MISEKIIDKSIDLTLSLAKKQFDKININIRNSKSSIYQAINQHIRIVKNWSSEITFKDLQASKRTTDIFIPLNTYIYPKRIRISNNENIRVTPLLDVLGREESHMVILGQPGAGKTTSMKYICQSIFFDEKFYPNRFSFPILIKLREFNNKQKDKNSAGIIIEFLFNLLGLELDYSDYKGNSLITEINRAKHNIVLELLDKLNILLVLDGFDELIFKSHRHIILSEIGLIANYFEISKLVVTSRTADYNYSNENISVFEICPLNDLQISEFASKWLGETNAKKFVKEVQDSPYNDTSIRPLTIAHLCAIYERIGKIPDKPKTVYKKIVNLLLEEWDEQRGIKRSSKYAMFEVDRKFEFLSSLAFHLTIKNGRAIFSKRDLSLVYQDIYVDFDLERHDSKDVINDLESHTGLFVQAGYDFYEFAHKSIQEYMAAEYIVKLPKMLDQKRLIERLPNELAITITISSNPSLYFIELVNNLLLKMDLSVPFIQTFINRLVLEKPDFYKNNEVGIAALSLYSSYMNQKTKSNQLFLFNSDYLIEEFEGLVDTIFKRNSKKIIKKLYKISDKFETVNQTTVLALKKKKLTSKQVDSNLVYSIQKSLPAYLFCRESFIKK